MGETKNARNGDCFFAVSGSSTTVLLSFAGRDLMKPLRAAFFALAMSIPAAPAHAALIGLIGGDFDPEELTDPSFFGVGACDQFGVELPEDYRCVFYHYDDDVDSIQFRLDDGSGLIPSAEANVTINVDTENSDFDTLAISLLFGDLFTFDLSGETLFPPGCEFESECGLLGLTFFVAPDEFHPDITDFSVSVVGINNSPNPGALPVPEPATLFLMGPAFAALLAGRARRNRKA
jgi:hypothetical protein